MEGQTQQITLIFKEKNNKKLTIELPPSTPIKDTIESLNEYFQVSESNGVKLYRLDNKSGLLDENKTFAEEGVNPGDILYGYVQGLQYTIFATNTHNNKSCRLELDKTATLQSVRDVIAKNVGLSRGGFAFYRDPVINENGAEPLDPNKTFEELEIPPLGNIYVREVNEGGCF